MLLPWLLPAWASENLADFRIRLFEFSVLNFALEFEENSPDRWSFLMEFRTRVVSFEWLLNIPSIVAAVGFL